MRIWAVLCFIFIILLQARTVTAVEPSVPLPVREGARGAEVKKIQARLRDLGFYPGLPDGVFGPKTTAAVKRFQAAHRLPAVGFVGPQTYRELFETQAKSTVAPKPSQRQVKPAQGAAKPATKPSVDRPARSRLPLPDPEPEALGRAGGRIALTFDDGPDPSVLPGILATLDRYGARGTFFVEGRKAAAQPDLLRRMVRSGHEVENHAFSHRPLSGMSSEEAQKEILDTAEVVRRATGGTTRFLRPPAGALDDGVAAAARETGHRVALWTNVGAPDQPFPGRERLVADILASSYDGAVIMLHADRPDTAAALPDILEGLKKKGYRLVRLDELMGR